MDDKDTKRLIELQNKKIKEKKLSDAEEGEFRILLKKYNIGYITRGEASNLVNGSLQQFEGRIAPFVLAFNAIQALLVRYDILTTKEIETKKTEIVEEAKRRQAVMIEKMKLEQEKLGVENKKKVELTEEKKVLEKQIELPLKKKDTEQVVTFKTAKDADVPFEDAKVADISLKSVEEDISRVSKELKSRIDKKEQNNKITK